MSYITKNFLLKNKTAERLYFEVAKDQPIFDYHCHLSEKEILEDKPLEDIFEAWLKSDHYKWRLMRNFGVDEEYITGAKTNKEKFLLYCKVIGLAIGNPLQHWSQLELEKYFNCDLEINENNGENIWKIANKYIKENKLTPSKLILSSNVKYIFTTNQPFDDLSVFEKINNQKRGYEVYPAFRGDALINIGSDAFKNIIEKYAINSLDKFESIIIERIKMFKDAGTKASDISLAYVVPVFDKIAASKVFNKSLLGDCLTEIEKDQFIGYMTYFLAKEFKKAGFALEIHLGAKRNGNSKMFNILGPDSGYDSINEFNTTEGLSELLDKLNNEDSLPKVILFNLNRKMNTELLTLMGSFQDSSAKGKMQYGPAWWFLDNKEGIISHLKDFTSLAHLDSFVGMLTDSRSLLSYERHQYFRRILCNFIGELSENGEATRDFTILSEIVKDVCYLNAINYFEMK